MASWFAQQNHQNEEEERDAPPGEAELTAKIKMQIEIGAMSAKMLGKFREAGNPGPEDELYRYELERYLKYRKKVADLADSLTDVYFREFAIHLLAEMCLQAGDVSEARKLFHLLTVELFCDRLIEQWPQISEPLRLAEIIGDA
jgi:hypothetical protein